MKLCRLTLAPKSNNVEQIKDSTFIKAVITAASLSLSKRSNRYIRSLLVEATWIAVRGDVALQTHYSKHSAKEPNKAIIKVTHKLLSRIRAVIITGIPYQTGLMKKF